MYVLLFVFLVFGAIVFKFPLGHLLAFWYVVACVDNIPPAAQTL